MKFYLPEGKTESSEINADYESAERFERIRVGGLGVFYPEAFRTRFIPYEAVEQVFIRIHEVNGKLCCGSTVFQYFRLVFVKNGKEIADYINEDEEAMRGALKAIEKKAPKVKIGL